MIFSFVCLNGINLHKRERFLMISIILNGQTKQVDDDINIDQLLHSMDLSEKRLAVEINQQIISRSDFPSHNLKDQDKVEIVQAIGGG